MKLIHIKNCGILAEMQNVRIMIDGLHRISKGYDGINTKEFSQMLKADSIFAGTDILIFTHHHPDHYDSGMVQAFLNRFPKCCLIVGEDFHRELYIRGQKVEIFFYDVPHSGTEWQGIKHQAVLIRTAEESLLITGDADYQQDKLIKSVLYFMKEQQIDVAFFNPFFIATEEGRKTIAKVHACKTFIYHIPVESDDLFSIRMIAQNAYHIYYQGRQDVELVQENMCRLI